MKAGAGECTCKRCVRRCTGMQCLGYRRHGLFDRCRNASCLEKTIMIEPAEKQRPNHVARLAALNEFREYLHLGADRVVKWLRQSLRDAVENGVPQEGAGYIETFGAQDRYTFTAAGPLPL